MSDRTNALFVLFMLLLCVAGDIRAQTGKKPGTVLDGWDRNQNGLLEKSEIPPAARKKIQELAKEQGLDPAKALPIRKLLAKDKTKRLQAAKVAAGKGKVSKKVEKRRDGLEGKAKPALSTTEDSKSSASGFGSARPSARARGFGTNRPPSTSAAKAPSGKPAQASDEGKAKESREKRQLRMLVRSMLAQHDRNKNGKLEKNEWARLRGNPGASDRNEDGVLTSDEIEDHLAGFATREKDPRMSRRSKSSPSLKKGTAKKTYRFLTAHERLPTGLPDWFIEKDLNEDGQLSLREYATRLSQTQLDEFLMFDLNKDGLIVPKEYLKSTD